ncbi:hypothetical protein JEY40_31970 [Bradyrhizobium japonicum]|uniref:hypothetical protein n=1 Tax=Bradyrhizobium japonicum TaxID=375 RepID=UPI00200F8A6D|nr:hypothetical protein [Bradyrhizobium japonicum]UQD77642.1 hypothetical protein JEY40_31970 [Bradyrhizobium japonicum]
METVRWIISTAPEISLRLAIAIGPLLGVAVPYAVGNVLLTVLGPIVVAATHTG